ncbi:UNVERIFIED_CONTAM: hypothetical protein KB573_10305 [Streptococcus canis]|nr:hypothetical protein [Streptococcus canis]MDV6002108.1 hypothetical protein [Streptococcus canis]
MILVSTSTILSISSVYANTLDTNQNSSQVMPSTNVEEIIDEDTGVVKEAIIKDNNLNKTTQITSDDQYVYIKTTQNGSTQTQQYQKRYIVDPQDQPQITPRSVEMINGWYPKGPWEYTGIAIGANFFTAITDFGIGALTSTLAAAFGITKAAAGFLLSYMGASYVSTGRQLANLLDVNKNGWIGLYARPASRYLNGPTEVYLHKTL